MGMRRSVGWSAPVAALIVVLAGCAGSTAPTAPAAELMDTHWRVSAVDGKPVAAYRGTREPHIILRREGARVTGFAGCNTLAGSYQLSGDSLRMGPLAVTRMACLSAEANAMEAGFLKGLEQTASYRITGTVLELRDAGGSPRIRLEAAAPR